MIRKIIVPIIVLALCGAITYGLVTSKPEVETKETPVFAPLVRALVVEPRTMTFTVEAQGTVVPRTESSLVARVAGQVEAVAPDFEVGGFFRRGEVLVRLDARDFELAVEQAAAQVAQAEVVLAQQEAEAEVAKEEWEELGVGEPSALTLRQPQVAQAKAALAAARAQLAKAELDLERTRIRAPFEGRVRQKSADLGQFLAPGTPVARIHGTDYAEIRLPVPDDALRFLDLDYGSQSAGSRTVEGPRVTLTTELAGELQSWQGRVVRSEGELDPRSRMLPLVARVEDPYGRRSTAEEGKPPLMVGLFVEATIEGMTRDRIFVVPRSALRPGDEVLVIDGEDRLRFRPVEVLRREGESLILSGGLEAGERVCVSPLDVAVDGMKVRVTLEEGETAAEETEPTTTDATEEVAS